MTMRAALFGRGVETPEACLESAGSALACLFSSSDEFEAAIIRARREAGVYGRSAKRRQLYCGIAFVTLLALILVAV